jgi:hypothetical protein
VENVAGENPAKSANDSYEKTWRVLLSERARKWRIEEKISLRV